MQGCGKFIAARPPKTAKPRHWAGAAARSSGRSGAVLPRLGRCAAAGQQRRHQPAEQGKPHQTHESALLPPFALARIGEGMVAAGRRVVKQAPAAAAPHNAAGPREDLGAPRGSSSRQRPTLPPRYQGSTIGAGGLNGSVRNGKRCGPSAIATGKTRTCIPATVRR